MPNEQDQLPAVFVLLLRAPSRHPREPDAVVNGVIQRPIGQALRSATHVRSLRIQVLSDLGVPVAVIGVANSTVVGEVGFARGLCSSSKTDYIVAGNPLGQFDRVKGFSFD